MGESVLAYQAATGATGAFTVTDVISHDDALVVALTLDDETLDTTPEHPFYAMLRGWVAASELRVGDTVRRQDGSYGRVAAVALERRAARMYNLTVADAHTFFVGDAGWLVHNTNPCLTASPQLFRRSHSLEGKPSTRKIIDLANDMKVRGWQGDPILVVQDAVGNLIIADGHHRVQAARLAGLESIPYHIVTHIDELSATSWRSLDEIRLSFPGRDKLDEKLLIAAGFLKRGDSRWHR